jgi:hypothetical protein
MLTTRFVAERLELRRSRKSDLKWQDARRTMRSGRNEQREGDVTGKEG